MVKKAFYKEQNQAFLQEVAEREGVKQLPKGILVEELKCGDGKRGATPRSIVSVYYKGSLINGKVFDDNTGQGYPDAFRLNELIVGWQIAIPQMRVGDKWRIYLPAEVGYGNATVDGIPKNSTLIFEIELVSVA